MNFLSYFDNLDNQFHTFNDASIGQTFIMLTACNEIDHKMATSFENMVKRYFIWAKKNNVQYISDQNITEYKNKVLPQIEKWKNSLIN